MSSPVVSPKADLVFFQDETHYTSKSVDLTESYGLDSENTSAFLENGVSLLFTKQDKSDQVEPAGFINYIDNFFHRVEPPMSALSSTINFNLPEGIINAVGSAITDVDSDAYQKKAMVHTIVGGSGKFLGRSGFAVIEPIERKDLRVFVWKVFFTDVEKKDKAAILDNFPGLYSFNGILENVSFNGPLLSNIYFQKY